jgi:hypothetical protein
LCFGFENGISLYLQIKKAVNDAAVNTPRINFAD